MLSSESFITAENLADTPYTYRYQGRQIVLQPHMPMPIPWKHMTLIAGNPFANETDRTNLRSDEVERLRNYHGIYSDDARWADRHPLSFTDDEGNVVPTPYTHPDGIGAATSTDPTDISYLVARLRKSEEDQTAMKVQIAQLTAAQDATAASHTVADIPETPEPGPAVRTGQVSDKPANAPKPVTAAQKAKAASTAPTPPAADDGVTTDTPSRTKVTT